MLATITVRARSVLNPFLNRPSQRTAGEVLRTFIAVLSAIVGGAGIALRQGLSGTGSRETVTIEYATDAARATVTCAAVQTGDTITSNGAAITGAQKRASCTLTVGNSVDEDDTVTVNGVVFTAKTAPSGNYQFAITGVAATDAAALAAKINAATTRSNDAASAGIYNKIECKVSTATITLYAIDEGTAGNLYTIASSDAVDLAITNDSSGFFANGAAAENDKFDFVGNNERTARSVVNNLNASTTGALSDHVRGSCRRAVVTCASVAVSDWVEVDGTRLRAIAQATDSGGNRITTFDDDVWSQAGNDTADGTSLVNCIHNHPKLRERFFAVNSSGAVSIYERFPEASYAERPTIASSNGSRLAVTNSASRFEDSAAVLIQSKRPGVGGNATTIATGNGTRLAITNDSSGRLTGGASTTLSF